MADKRQTRSYPEAFIRFCVGFIVGTITFIPKTIVYIRSVLFINKLPNQYRQAGGKLKPLTSEKNWEDLANQVKEALPKEAPKKK